MCSGGFKCVGVLLLGVKKLREWHFFRLGVQACIDITNSGIIGVVISAAQMQNNKPYSESRQTSNFLWSYLARPTNLSNWGWCVVEYLRFNFYWSYFY